tara:strand:+ start:156 stop:260 length:105 start_codon:yes stop_codon:yes gene_type:complete
MEMASSFDLAGFCLLAVIHAGVLALRLGISLQRS